MPVKQLSSKSPIDVIKDVFSSRNILTIAITTSMITLCDMGWRPFWALYLNEVLGASVWAISFLSMLSQSERLLFQLPGGVLADRFGRRKIIVYGTALRIFTPMLFLWAKDWVTVIPALVLNGVTSIYMPAFNAIIADSLPDDERGAGYGAYRMITSTPQIFSPVVGGFLFERMGPAQGFRLFMYLSIIVNAIVTYARHRIITETLFDEEEMKKKARTRPPIKEQVKDTMTLGRTVWTMVLVAVISAFAARMVYDLVALYARDVIGLSYAQLGIVTTVGGIITTVLAMPGGMLSDRIGRKPVISLSRVLTPISMFGVTLSQNFYHYLVSYGTNALSEALGGGGRMGSAGGPAWQALVADLVPKEKRATVMGTIGTITGTIAAPASLAGSWLWNNLGPVWPFRASALAGLVAVGIFWVGVKEPPRRRYVEIIDQEESQEK
ncbi:MAG TPA: MFS transporter [Candidatus Bathyarchaeota archaeon]|nr:MFS transporter [Candidatus Bathyarchaeota archaeon]